LDRDNRSLSPLFPYKYDRKRGIGGGKIEENKREENEKQKKNRVKVEEKKQREPKGIFTVGKKNRGGRLFETKGAENKKE
jgi:hypothetical protein